MNKLVSNHLTKKTLKSSRAVAALILDAVLGSKQNLTTVLSQYKTQIENAKDASLIQNLCFGVLRWESRLSFIANCLIEKPLKEKERIILYLIYVGLYQLLFTRIPDHAAISETVEASKLLEKPWAANLINAVLRNFKRKQDEILKQVELNPQAKFAHPLWWIKILQKAWPNDWESILNANNEEPPFSLRVNIKKVSRTKYLELLQNAGLECTEIKETSAGILLKTPKNVKELPHFEQGFSSVQDGAAQFAAALLDLKPKLRILDACAAPGGKTTDILEREPELEQVTALDISEERCQLIEENITRLGLGPTLKSNKVKVITANALEPEKWWDGIQFDRILLDAPCTASGIIRRHPDIKVLRQEKDIKKLSEQQFALLKTLFPLLKPGGLLLYATCSVLPEENQELIEKFTNYQKDAIIIPIELPVGFQQNVGHQILPGQNGMDGFYYAKIMRIENKL